MPCFKPTKAWQYLDPKMPDKPIFHQPERHANKPIELPCGKCIGCRSDKALDWTVRMTHEASLYEYNQFVTLTYDEENIPHDFGLHHKHYQDWIRKLRKHYPEISLRYYMCGEYGEINSRPHFHAAIFNLNITDLEQYSERDGHKTFTSKKMTKIWGKGNVIMGESLTPQSCAYIAGYMLKELKAIDQEHGFRITDLETGQEFDRISPYQRMSNRPGIGRNWIEKYQTDTFPDDFIILDGKRFPVPDYYLRRLKDEDPKLYEEIKSDRVTKMESKQFAENSTPERLEVREKVKLASVKQKRKDL